MGAAQAPHRKRAGELGALRPFFMPSLPALAPSEQAREEARLFHRQDLALRNFPKARIAMDARTTQGIDPVAAKDSGHAQLSFPLWRFPLRDFAAIIR